MPFPDVHKVCELLWQDNTEMLLAVENMLDSDWMLSAEHYCDV